MHQGVLDRALPGDRPLRAQDREARLRLAASPDRNWREETSTGSCARAAATMSYVPARLRQVAAASEKARAVGLDLDFAGHDGDLEGIGFGGEAKPDVGR